MAYTALHELETRIEKVRESIFFSIKELVSKKVYEKCGNNAWQFFDPRLIMTIDWIQDRIGVPLTINDWHLGGGNQLRGLITNVDPLMQEYFLRSRLCVSPHAFGQAIDFTTESMTPQHIRQWIIENQYNLPHPIRLKGKVDWVHIDVRNTGSKISIYT